MSLEPLLSASPAIQLHAVAAIAAFVLGAVVLWRRKGDRLHRLGGRIWVALMLVVALSSFFIHTIRMWGPWSPIHLLSIATIAALGYAVWQIRHHNVLAHAGAMRGTYVGALIVAGFFTLAPGRIMNEVIFGAGEAAAAPAASGAATHAHPGALAILTGTPFWVWPLLAYVLFIGWMRTRQRVVAPARLFVMPAIATALALHSLFAAGPTPLKLVAFASGVAAGALAGYAVGRRVRATRRADGMLQIPGDWMPLALMAGIFAVRYGQGVTRALDPVLAASPAFVLTTLFVSGLFAALFAARTLAQLPAGVVALPSRASLAR